MPEILHSSLDQLAFTQVKHKAGCGKLLDGFKHVLYHPPLSVLMYGYVVQIDDYRQRAVAWCTEKDTLNHKLEMGWHLHEVHRYPEPPELVTMCNKKSSCKKKHS